jgi:peptidoglycan hydrolase-like protein with peptidoglycan-binding domain
VSLRWNGGRLDTVARTGSFLLDPRLPDGSYQLQVVARDRTGNRTVRVRHIVVDSTSPTVIDTVKRVVRTPDPTLKVRIADAQRLRLTVRFDGDSARLQAPHGSPNGTYRLPLRNLPEGTHTLAIDAVDPAGNTTSVQRTFVIDSTEKLTPRLVITRGAQGRDVLSLQQRLAQEGFWKGSFTRHYDARTVAAVKRLQHARAMVEDGIAGPGVIGATSGRLVVHLHDFRVSFVRNGRVLFSAPIAIGQPRYPTPVGRFAITSKIKDPTWIPPNSPWAAGLEAIPPGVKNPLGSRWIGTSAPNVGFHATNAPSSVGRPASHGCMRMYQSDVERLYDLVAIGMAVDIEP